MFLLVVLLALVIASLCYAFGSIVASAGKRLLSSESPSQSDARQQEIQVLLGEVEDLQYRLNKLQEPLARRKLPG